VVRKKDVSAGAMDALRPDIRAAAARLGSRLRDPGELAPVEGYLHEHETVRFVVQGTYERAGGVLVLTDARLIFFHRRVTKPSLDLSLGAISAVSTSSGLSTGEIALAVGEKTVAVSRIVKADLEPLAHAVRRAREAAPDEPPPEDPVAPVDPFVAMEKLSALRDRGVITEAEFAAKKQELLDRL
jgi:hypothetical protein